MLSVWIKTAGIVLVIVIGYIMKKSGAFPESTAKVLSRLSLTILLPFVYICNLNGIVINRELLSALLWGLGVDMVLTAAAVLLYRRKPKDTVFILHYCITGFNTTGFALPVLQLFASEYEVASLTPVLMQIYASGEKHISVKSIVRSFRSNIAALTSLAMLLLCLLKIALPDVLITAFRPSANANAAVALLALGLLFEFPKKLPKDNITALAVRLLITVSAAAVAWSGIIPFGAIRNAMIIVMFAPLPSAGPAVALTQGFEGSEIAFGVSASLIISVVAMTVLCGMMF